MKDKVPDKIDKVIFDYLSGDMSPGNQNKLEKLRNKSEHLDAHVKSIEHIWQGESGDRKLFDTGKAYLNLGSNIMNQQAIRPNTLGLKNIFYRAAAIILILLGTAYAAYLLGFSKQSQGNPVTISCASGENAEVILPDGSHVWLNSASSITYNSSFNKDTRDVCLKGEAYFQVESDKDHPFNVVVDDYVVTATGTRFNVKAYADDAFAETSLMEGKVFVMHQNKQYAMKAGEVVTLDKKQNTWYKRKIKNSDFIIGWKDGKLIFKNESILTLKRRFERFYDVNIESDPSVDTIRFSGVLQYESIDELLYILNQTQGIVAKKDGKSIYLNLSVK